MIWALAFIGFWFLYLVFYIFLLKLDARVRDLESEFGYDEENFWDDTE